MAESRLPQPTPARAALLAVPAAILTAALCWVRPEHMAAAALTVWITCLSATIGGAVWLLIARLTGGVWPRACEATLSLLSRATPLVALFGIAIYLLGPILYPWWSGIEGLKGEIYLVPWSFALRGVVILVLWALIGWLAPLRLPKPLAAVLLVAYGISIGIAGLDWILSRDPHMLSTTIGMLFAAMQLGLAMALCALRGLDTSEPRAVADCGGLLLATCLGNFYLSAMQFLVSWSGNLPIKAEWFNDRTDGAGTIVMIVTFLIGVVLPFAVLIQTRHRGSAESLRPIGACVAAAALLHFVWLCAPGGMLIALLGTLSVVVLGWALAAPIRARRTSHG